MLESLMSMSRVAGRLRAARISPCAGRLWAAFASSDHEPLKVGLASAEPLVPGSEPLKVGPVVVVLWHLTLSLLEVGLALSLRRSVWPAL